MVVESVRSKKHPHSFVLRGVSWRLYKAMLHEFNERPSRINYDRGILEVMTLSIEHERYKMILGEMLGRVAEVFRIRMSRGGSATLKRMAKRKGLEADLCYWTTNELAIRTKKRINLRTDPPPDLVIEIDIMHSVVNRESIYAAFGVPEMWVLRRDATIHAYRLEAGQWQPIERSTSFPFLRVGDLNPFVKRIGVDDDTSVIADFAQWLQQLKSQQSR